MAGVKGRSGGHNRRSAEQHVLDGTYREDRHAGREHPRPEIGTPDAPAALTGVARREWNRLTALLADTEMLTLVDGAMLFHYCEMFGDLQGAKADIARMRRQLSNKRLDIKGRVEIQKQIIRVAGQMLRYRQQIRMYLAEFGLSPKSRLGVDISPAGAGLAKPPGEKGDEMSEFDVPPPLKLVNGHGQRP